MLKRQVITIDMSVERPNYKIDSVIELYCTEVKEISAYTKDSDGVVTYLNTPVYDPIKIGNWEVFPYLFDLGLIHPKAANRKDVQEVNVPITNGTRITGSVTNPNSAVTLILLLTLEAVDMVN